MLGTLGMAWLCTATGGLYAQEYSEEFVGGQPAVPQCVAWKDFVGELVEQD